MGTSFQSSLSFDYAADKTTRPLDSASWTEFLLTWILRQLRCFPILWHSSKAFKQVAQEDNDRSPETQHASNQGHITPK